MNLFKRRLSGIKGRVSRNRFVTKSGSVVKLHRSIGQRIKSHKDSLARMKANRLHRMPKGHIKRFFYRFRPNNLYHYWFSREGGIMALKVTGIGIISGFLLLVGLFAYFRKDLPDLRHDLYGTNTGGSIRYYDRTGQTLLWEDYDAVKRVPVKDEEISQFMKDATIAVEDKDFFKHSGFDVRAIARAGWNNVVGGGGTQGGSTITQQLVKLNLDWSNERTVTRKIKELILSVELERSYTKQEILTGYLNTAPYGNIQYGVETATRDYFQKSAKDLALHEAAFLAALPKSPSFYSPYGPDFNAEALVGRQHYILDLMEQQGMITKEQRDEAKKIDTVATVKDVNTKYEGIKAPWFVLAAKDQLERKVFNEDRVKRGGLKVTTTLDIDKQNIAEEEVAKGLAQVRRQGGDTAAFVAEDVKTGQVVALVGGADFSNAEYGQNNYAYTYRLPPGSSFKPYDYISLIEHGGKAGAGSVLYDSQDPLPGHYPCTTGPKRGGNCLTDFDFRYPGPMTIRYALGGSRNVPAVKAMLIAGIEKTAQTAQDLGLESGYKCYKPEIEDVTNATEADEAPCGGSAGIGDGAYLKLNEHVHGFASISRNGRNIPQAFILKVEDVNNKVLNEWKPTAGKQAVRDESAYIIADILADPRASYFSNKPHLYKGHKFSLKTGTTNDAKDGWLLGFSTQYSAGVWVGHHKRRVAMSGSMEIMTAPIWGNWMRRVHDSLQPEERVRPKGIQSLPAFVVRNHVGFGSIEPSPANDLFPSWYEQKKKGAGSKRTIDTVSNKIATECTPARAKKEVTEVSADTFSVDIFHGAGTANGEEKDDIHKCGDTKPSITFVSAPNPCNDSCTFVVDVTAGTHPLSSEKFTGVVNFKIDGQIVTSFNVSGATTLSIPYDVTIDGDHTASVEVIDSVLYDNSDSRTINFNSSGGGGGSLTITDPTPGEDVGGATTISTTLSWTGGIPNYSVTLSTGSPQPQCSGSGTSCTLNLPAGSGTYTVTVTDNSGSSASRTFSK